MNDSSREQRDLKDGTSVYDVNALEYVNHICKDLSFVINLGACAQVICLALKFPSGQMFYIRKRWKSEQVLREILFDQDVRVCTRSVQHAGTVLR